VLELEDLVDDAVDLDVVAALELIGADRHIVSVAVTARLVMPGQLWRSVAP
jgi:hypothetical protein